MIERYANPKISEIFSDTHKVSYWQQTELKVIEARSSAGIIPGEAYGVIARELAAHPCDIAWWHEREKALHHDLQAWIEERLRWIPQNYRQYWHQGMTSYDTEESAFVLMLREATTYVRNSVIQNGLIIRDLAIKYRYTPMIGRTHGQWADLQSFGKRCLSWHQLITLALDQLSVTTHTSLRYSKLSGAVGNYTGVTPDIEHRALKLMQLEPYYGATQILPRALFVPHAQALLNVVNAFQQIALDIRLSARSGYAIIQEPFGSRQKGSSAMPHKKNTINTEKIEGMSRLATRFTNMIE
ncbi:hypothetical protein HY065_00910, partial [Candidatus Berkelbacteria bacterium]|nr:hypothetical protein [Candidatus Berkelbacteria bacterium]